MTEFHGKALEYTLELELHLFFIPLMQDWGDGIVMTRTLQLPLRRDRSRRVCHLKRE
ncbi:hypothetical protein [Rosistilla oblonga]|uniref:Uncharacterized protein n=1 Tax=Rosistilla oblonga TaxID=2527990 RepID=A0A518J041_9BACT|nr:hypothetical protein [Rosistilla oblonga]QDV58714.1 hypothetical protein Mal33_47390 [Rosistilla oblonga]